MPEIVELMLLLISTIEVIREKVQDGVTGETRDMQYTQCKIVGNGSFGVVFQTKLSPSGEDALAEAHPSDRHGEEQRRETEVHRIHATPPFEAVDLGLRH